MVEMRPLNPRDITPKPLTALLTFAHFRPQFGPYRSLLNYPGEWKCIKRLAVANYGKVYLFEHLPTKKTLVIKRMANDRTCADGNCADRGLLERYTKGCDFDGENPLIELGASAYVSSISVSRDEQHYWKTCTDPVALLHKACNKKKPSGYPGELDFHCPYILRMQGCWTDQQFTYYASDPCMLGELFSLVSEKKRLTEFRARLIMRQIMIGVKWMHDRGIAHRDISLENVLITDDPEDRNARLMDMGVACSMFEESPTGDIANAYQVTFESTGSTISVGNPNATSSNGVPMGGIVAGSSASGTKGDGMNGGGSTGPTFSNGSIHVCQIPPVGDRMTKQPRKETPDGKPAYIIPAHSPLSGTTAEVQIHAYLQQLCRRSEERSEEEAAVFIPAEKGTPSTDKFSKLYEKGHIRPGVLTKEKTLDWESGWAELQKELHAVADEHYNRTKGNLLRTVPQPNLDSERVEKERQKMHKKRKLVKIGGFVGKDYYRAPEVYGKGSMYYPAPTDIFAVGVMLFIMVTGRPIWKKAMAGDHLYDFLVKCGFPALLKQWKLTAPPLSLTPEVLDLVERMVEFDPECRATADEVLAHPWFQLDLPMQMEREN